MTTMTTAAEKAIQRGATDVTIIGRQVICGGEFEISQSEHAYFAEPMDNSHEALYVLYVWDCEAQIDEDGSEYLPGVSYSLEFFIAQIEEELSNPKNRTRLTRSVRVPYPGC